MAHPKNPFYGPRLKCGLMGVVFGITKTPKNSEITIVCCVVKKHVEKSVVGDGL